MMQRLFGLFGEVTPNSDFLLEQGEFTRLVHSERRRADRSGSKLALVKFNLIHRRDSSAREQLCSAIQDRLRETDEAGLLQDGQLGVILPDTHTTGAWTFANAVQHLTGRTVEVEIKVYVYPDANRLPMNEDTDSDENNSPGTGKELEQLLVAPLPTWKRSLDLIVAPLALIALFPVLLVAAVAIRITSKGPVVFRQARSGRGGKPFFVYKLRTMCLDAESRRNDLLAQNEQDGPAFKIKHDPRITPVGRFLRRTCIDELPQLWNVIRGDMTLVGPRPLPCHETNGCQGWERRRLEVTPGLTCIWQVEGGTRVSFAEWMRMDIRYINSRRMSRDLMLLWKTGVKVVMQRASH